VVRVATVQTRRNMLAVVATGLLPWWRALGIGSALAAEDQEGGDVVRAVAQVAAAPSHLDVATGIDQQITAFLRESGLARRERRNELSTSRGVADVRVNASNPDWVRFRTLAYERAYAQAQTAYLTSQGLRIVSQASNDFYKAAGEEPPPYDAGAEQAPGRINDLLRKLVGAADGRVNELLRSMNIDPRQYEVTPPPQRYVMLSDAFRRSTIRRALGELVGMVPCKSFEAHDGQGNFQIGVLAVVSPKMKDFAIEMRRRRGEFEPDPARAGNLDALTENKDDLVRQFGVRQIFDEDGGPVLVGFGQWAAASLGAGGGNARAAALDRAAVSQARATADAQIGFFLSASAAFETNNEVGDLVESAASRLPDNYIQQEADTAKLLDAVRERLQVRSNSEIVGLKDLEVWRHKHPVTGREIVGVVRIWTAAAERATRALRDRRPPSPARAPAVVPGQGQPGSAAGRTLMRTEDF